MYPQQSPTTHTEQLGEEASVYDWARAQVHALNPTAARVWRQCDGATSLDAIAAALRVEMGIPEAEAVVDFTLRELARLHLLEVPVDSRVDRPARTRRWLLGRGVAAAMLPAIYSIVAPSPVEAQSPAGAPTFASVSPNQGSPGTTVPVTLTGTNFVVGATTVTVNSGGVTATNVIASGATSLTADIVITAAAVLGVHTVTVTTARGTSGAQTFTVNPPPPGSTTFNFTGGPQTFTVPAGVVGITIVAAGAQGGLGLAEGAGASGGTGGLGGRTTATVSVTPGASLTVLVGSVGPNGFSAIATPGGFNGGGGSAADGGGGGGASSVRNGATPLVVAGGGGGGGGAKGPGDVGANGGAGGGLSANPGQILAGAAGPGGGGGQIVGGLGGFRAFATSTNTDGSAGAADQGGDGGMDLGLAGGGGGGGGHFGGGGGGGGSQLSDVSGGGGGGGSSFTAPGATGVVHLQGNNSGNGSVTISW